MRPPSRGLKPAEALYMDMLKDYRRYTETLWHAVDGQPGMGYWGSGKADGGNEGVRAVSNTALACATLYHFGDRAFTVQERIEPALRYSAAIYAGGPLRGTDGKQWGSSWQSAMWAGNLGVAAYIVRDALAPETLEAVKKVVAAEADRFIGVAPPEMAPGDTKSEENAWNLMAPAAALLLMPDHERASGLREALLRYGFNTLSVEADKTSNVVRDGRPLREWVTTAQLFPDFTLENHGFFHPVYAMVGAATLGHAAVALKMGGQDTPDALRHNVLREWDTLKAITLPDGEWAYPQGLDWDLHDYEHIPYWAMLATMYDDPAAIVLERKTAAHARRRQKLNGDGRFVGPSGNLGFAREAVQAERVAYSAWMHALFPAVVPEDDSGFIRMFVEQPTVRVFERAGFAVLSGWGGVSTFSWKNRAMGLVIPTSHRHEAQPYVTTPFTESVVGSFEVEGVKPADRFLKVSRHAVRTQRDSFLVAMDGTASGGALRHMAAAVGLASGAFVYLDHITATRAVTVTEERGLPVGIENHAFTSGFRRINTREGAWTARAGADTLIKLAGPWANVDGRLGVVSPGEDFAYEIAAGPNRPGAAEDYLFGQYRDERRGFQAGDSVAQRVGIFLPGATVDETRRVAGSAVVTRTALGVAVRFTDPAGIARTVTLSATGAASLDGDKVSLNGTGTE